MRRHPLSHGVYRHRTITERGPPGRWMAAIHRWPGTGLFEIETRIHPRIQHSDVAHIARHDLFLTEFFRDRCVSRLKVASMNDAGVDVHLELYEIRYSWVIFIAVRLLFGPVLFRYLDIYILSSNNSLCFPAIIKLSPLLNTSSGCRLRKKSIKSKVRMPSCAAEEKSRKKARKIDNRWPSSNGGEQRKIERCSHEFSPLSTLGSLSRVTVSSLSSRLPFPNGTSLFHPRNIRRFLVYRSRVSLS